MSVKPTKGTFVEKEALAFAVAFKNVSKKPFFLFDATFTYASAIKIQPVAGGPPHPVNFPEAKRLRPTVEWSKSVAPGTTLDINLNLDSASYGWVPLPEGGARTLEHLPAGRYRIFVERTFGMNPAPADWLQPHWTGKITAKPAEFSIAKPLKDPH